MSFWDEITEKRAAEQEEKLAHLSDLNRTLQDMEFERHSNGVYNMSFSKKDYHLICAAMKDYLLSAVREMQAHEGSKDDMLRQDDTLTADDFTDLHEIYREYSGSTRATTYIFTCKIQGEPDILTYELSLHNEYTEGFYLHTEKNDIWDDWDIRMGWKELEKLQKKANSAAAFGTYDREIRRAESPSELINLQYSLWDDDDPDLTPELREQIEQMIDQKIDNLRENCMSKEEWIFDLADPVERYAIYQLDTEKLKGKGNGYMFMGLDYVEKHGMKVQAADYYLAYGGVLEPGETLDSIYEKFNLNRPGDFKGHSLSISDVVILNRGGEVKAYYVDSWSFKELPDFAAEREQIASRHDLSIHWGEIKRDIFTAVNALERKARQDMLKQNSPWGSWFGRIADLQNPGNYIALDITGYTTRNSVTLSAQIVRNNEVQDMVLISDMPYDQFTAGETSFARQVVAADKVSEYASVRFYNPHGLMNDHPMEEHYDLLRQAGFDNDFPDNQAYAQRVTEQKQEMPVSSEQNERRNTPRIKR